MKRIGLMFAVPLAALVIGIAAPRAAEAAGWRGGGGGGHAAAPAHGGGWRGAPAGHTHAPAYGGRSYVGGGYGHGYYAPHAAVGHWGYHGGVRVWLGVPTVRPYAGWVWTPGQWVWDGYQWVWQEGYWAP
ncbi:MAG TPA: hypothetical protein VHJ20_12545 [Polyangia bacterium]|nr:hypothetical protein [Polyangia bacterium]